MHYSKIRPLCTDERMGRGEIGGGTALRLGRYFGAMPQFWLGLQMDYALDVAADELAERLESEVIAYANQ